MQDFQNHILALHSDLQDHIESVQDFTNLILTNTLLPRLYSEYCKITFRQVYDLQDHILILQNLPNHNLTNT